MFSWSHDPGDITKHGHNLVGGTGIRKEKQKRKKLKIISVKVQYQEWRIFQQWSHFGRNC